MISLITFILILGVSVIIHEFGHFITAKKLGVKVERFSLGFGKPLLSKKIKGTEYCISSIPMGAYVKIAGESQEEYKNNPDEFMAKTPYQRAKIIFSGPLLNYILGFLCFWLIFFVGYPTLTTQVGGLVEGFGAKDAGIQAGDKIIAVDGKRVDFWEDLQNIIQSKKEATKVMLLVSRNNKEYTTEVQIKEKQLDDAMGAKRNVGLIGIIPKDEWLNVKHGWVESFILGKRKTWDLTVLTYKGLWRIITGKLSIHKSVTGPLGVFYITSKVVNLGIIAVLHLLAVLNVSLCIFNLLPFPVLDGGHLVLLGIEKIRGRTLSLKIERVITQIGVTFLIFLALIATYNDLLMFFQDKVSKLFIK